MDIRRQPVHRYHAQHCSGQICAHSFVCIMSLQGDSRRELTETRGLNVLLLTFLKWHVKSSLPANSVHMTSRTWPDCCVSWQSSEGTPEGQFSESLGFSVAEVPQALEIKKRGWEVRARSSLSRVWPDWALPWPSATSTILLKVQMVR